MPTHFYVQVEPSYYENGALRIRVQIERDGKRIHTSRKDGLTLGDDKDQHARLLANLQTCDPDPFIEVEDAHFRFCFAWEREPGARKITRRCNHCGHPVYQCSQYCMNCHKELSHE